VAGEPALGEVLRALDAAEGDQPMHATQLRIVAELATKNVRQAAEVLEAILKSSDAINEEHFAPPGQHPLAQIEEFVAASRGWIERSAEHLADIAACKKPFAADKAFMLNDAHALARFVNLSLDRNEPWLAPLLEPMLIGSGVAPGETAKSAPSLAAAIGIAKAIAERPTAQALLALKAAAGKVRHATLQKKFAKLMRVAERRLAMRPDFILQIAPDFSVPKALQPAVKASFEALYRSGVVFSMADFEARILANAGLAAVAGKLIWRVGDGGATAMPAKAKSGWRWQDADGADVKTAPDSVISLWHPLGDDAVADRWRSELLEARIAQPFNQAFRETYVPDEQERAGPETKMFAGYDVDAKVLAGLATATGWRITDYYGLYLKAGDFTFQFNCTNVYPGVISATMYEIRVTRAGEPAKLGEVEPVVLSEVLRLADLLTSVGSFALKREDAANFESRPDLIAADGSPRPFVPGAKTARRRQEVLVRLFGETPQPDAPWVEGRYLCVKDVRIHIATGIARRDGAEFAAKPGAAITLPYPDAVLEKIVSRSNAVLASG
jgi:hypothetical protein